MNKFYRDSYVSPPAAMSYVNNKRESAAILRYVFGLTLNRIGQLLRVSRQYARCLILTYEHHIFFRWRRAAPIEASLIARELIVSGDAEAMINICSSIDGEYEVNKNG